MKALETIILYASIFSVAFPLGLYVYAKNFTQKAINLLACLLFASALADGSYLILKHFGKSNTVIVNTFFIIQFILASLIYVSLYLSKPKAYLKVLSSLGLVIILTNWIFWQGIGTLQNFTWASTSILIAAMALGHFSHLGKFPVDNVKQSGPYWISTGLLFYCCLSFVILGFSRLFAERLTEDEFRFVWMFHNINNIFKNICFFLAVWWAHRSPLPDLPKALNN